MVIIDPNERVGCMNELHIFEGRTESFANPGADVTLQETARMTPATWWKWFGHSTPNLKKYAIKLLSQTSSASNCERN